MSKKHKKALHYFKLHESLNLVSALTSCVLSSSFALLVVIAERIKGYRSIIKKREKKHNIIVLLAKNKLNTI